MNNNNLVKMPLRSGLGVIWFRTGGKRISLIVDPALGPRPHVEVRAMSEPREKVVSIAGDVKARRCRGVPIGDGYYTGCLDCTGEVAPYTDKNDCPICEGSGLEPIDREVYRRRNNGVPGSTE